MNVKEMYKQAYRLPRLKMWEMARESESSYPIGFDCPERDRTCGYKHECYCDERAALTERVGKQATQEMAAIGAIVPTEIILAAKDCYFAGQREVQRVGIVTEYAAAAGLITNRYCSNGRFQRRRESPERYAGDTVGLENYKQKIARVRQRVLAKLAEKRTARRDNVRLSLSNCKS